MKITQFIFGMLGISLVIGVHEFGHWSMCRIFGVATPTVSIGIGPSLFDFHVGKTQISLGMLPLGGYVEMLGSRLPVPGFEKKSFATKPFAQKALILLGGILFNLLFGLLAIFIVRRRERMRPRGSDSGDDQEPDQEEQPTQRIIGPLGILSLLMKSSEQSKRFYFFLVGVLSINLAIFNLFPLPLLDGGQLLLTAYESFTGNMFSDLTYDALSLITILIITALLIYTTGRDIGALRRKI